MATSLDSGCLADLGLGRRNSSATPTCNQSMLKLAPYSPEATAVFATAITLMILFTIVGNILVIIAVLTSRSLRGPQNLFLVSLAAADILVATLIIPFSLANELMGYWYFRSVWCEIYLALDVLFCTSSIVHLCAISLDRYLSISRAVTYGSQRTPRRIKGAIMVVWLISAVISFPPLLPMTKSQGGVDAAGGPQCQLNDEKWYILYSTIGSFFAPCLIMILVYVRIYQIAKKHTRGPPGEPRKEGAAGSGPQKSPVQSQNGRGEGGPATPQRVHKPRPLNLDAPPSPSPRQAKRSISPHNRLRPLSPSLAPTPTTPGSQPLGPFPLSTPSCSPVHQPDVANRPKESKKMKRAGNNNEDSSSSGSDMDQGIGQGDCGASVSRGFPVSGPHSPASAQRLRDIVATSKGAVLSGQRALQDGTPNSTRRKAMANREKRFTFVLAVVIGVFVVCWFPFFFSYSLQAVCPQVCSLPEPLFKFFFWIGYCNSCLNPVIYTIFNKDFRRAFKKILCKNTKGTFF